MKNIGLKIIACIFGIALWFYVVSARVTEVDLQVPLVFARLPENLAIASRPASTISITVRGTAIDLVRLKNAKANAARIVVDLHDAELGLDRIILADENFVAPDFPKVRFESSDQLTVLEVEIDTRISRTVPVHLNGSFSAKEGYTIIGTPAPQPDTISIAGAREALTRIFEIPTLDVSKQNLDSNENILAQLDFSKLPPYVYPSDSTVNIPISVEPLVRTSFQNIPVRLIGQYDHNLYSLEPATATVEISGGKGVLSQIEKSDIQLLIEFNRFAIEDADSLEPTVGIRGDIKSFQVNPGKFLLKRKLPADSSQTISPSDSASRKIHSKETAK